MRYHFEEINEPVVGFGIEYCCDHPVYDRCTLFKIGEKGLAVIRQYYDPTTKHTWWDMIDDQLSNAIYLHPNFKKLFDERSGAALDGIYPTISVRQLMWALKMKPLKRSRWETVFDKRDI